eukprot:5069335-Lingulodinium_polyedra.AAC.1
MPGPALTKPGWRPWPASTWLQSSHRWTLRPGWPERGPSRPRRLGRRLQLTGWRSAGGTRSFHKGRRPARQKGG